MIQLCALGRAGETAVTKRNPFCGDILNNECLALFITDNRVIIWLE